MVSKRIKECRSRKWKSARAFALEHDMKVSTYTSYENGSRVPDVDTIKWIAEKLGTTVDYLSGRTDDMSGYAGRFPESDAPKTMYGKICDLIIDSGYITTEGDLKDNQIEILLAVSKIIENLFLG